MRRWGWAFGWLALATVAHAQDDVLPVEQAFRLEASAPSRERVELRWTIAPHYYMYRDKIRVKPDGAGVEVGAIDTPPGERKVDEFLGDVEVYHDQARADVAIRVADPAASEVTLRVSVQGCHEVDPKICYPPTAQKLTLALPAAATAPAAPPSPFAIAAAALPGSPPTTATDSPSAALGAGTPVAGATDELPLPEEQAFKFEAIATAPAELLARFTMPPGYYLYRDRTRVTGLTAADGGLPVAHAPLLAWPPGVAHRDEHFGDVTVYYDVVEVPVQLVRTLGAAQRIALEVELQGCQQDGICYPPMRRRVLLDLAAATPEQVAASTRAEPAPGASRATAAAGGAPLSEQDRITEALRSGNRPLQILLFFVAGLLLAFTPCVFPMIPILTGLIAGAGDIPQRRALWLAAVYVVASALVFTVAGVIAGLASENLQAAFQKPWILGAFAALFVVLSLAMFGFYELQLPSSWQSRLANLSNQQKGGSTAGVAVMGALSALIVGPCVAPPLAAAVVYIAQQRDPLLGGLALFALGLGMGVPLIAFVLGLRLMPGAWMEAIKRVFGVLFLVLAVWMLERFVDATWVMAMLAMIAIGSGVYLGALERLPDDASGWRRLWKTCGVLLLLIGACELVGALGGARDYLQPLKGVFGGTGGAAHAELPFKTIKSSADLDRELAAAGTAGKPVLFDFYADWCVACKEMEKYTLPKPEVQAELAGFVLLKADVTPNDDVDQALMQRFGIIGPPATLFFDCAGNERRAARLIGYEEAAAFVTRLRGARRCDA